MAASEVGFCGDALLLLSGWTARRMTAEISS